MIDFREFPDKSMLEKSFVHGKKYKANGHIHTPYSFSAFDSIPQVFKLAAEENIKAIGINDFIVTDGYAEFARYASRSKVFPLFNIEFMGLVRDLQKKSIRINDPNNPGRIYFSGKGLRFPVEADGKIIGLLEKVKAESNLQTRKMAELLDNHLKQIGSPFRMDFEEIKSKLARELVRERHLAKALRILIFENFPDENARMDFVRKLYGGKISESINSISGFENEIRSKLLKKGGVAFVEEDESAFLELDKIIGIIVSLGGIPCYPVLLDDSKGNLTEFESDYEVLQKELESRKINCIELIPGRNDAGKLLEFVRFFRSKGFLVTFGTEHNTPELTPLTVKCRNDYPLGEEMETVNHEGICIMAAHQYLNARGEEGYIDHNGNAKTDQYNYLSRLGQGVIEYFLNN